MKYYLDSSFIVECLFSDGTALRLLNQLQGMLFTSQIGRTETIRTVQKFSPALLKEAEDLLGGIALLDLSDEVLRRVESFGSYITLKTLDAIHVASAESILEEEDYLVTLDAQMSRNAQLLGIRVKPI